MGLVGGGLKEGQVAWGLRAASAACSSRSCCGAVSGKARRSKGEPHRDWRWMTARIATGAVMPNAMGMASPCSVLGTSALGAHGQGFVHAGWAMPGAEQKAEDASLFIRWPSFAHLEHGVYHKYPRFVTACVGWTSVYTPLRISLSFSVARVFSILSLVLTQRDETQRPILPCVDRHFLVDLANVIFCLFLFHITYYYRFQYVGGPLPTP
jgi:hypothetical protein